MQIRQHRQLIAAGNSANKCATASQVPSFNLRDSYKPVACLERCRRRVAGSGGLPPFSAGHQAFRRLQVEGRDRGGRFIVGGRSIGIIRSALIRRKSARGGCARIDPTPPVAERPSADSCRSGGFRRSSARQRQSGSPVARRRPFIRWLCRRLSRRLRADSKESHWARPLGGATRASCERAAVSAAD